jgi:hypothetical protein
MSISNTASSLLATHLLRTTGAAPSAAGTERILRQQIRAGIHAQVVRLFNTIVASRGKMKQKVGFELELQSSSLPGSGSGVFINGSAPTGSVVAFYPGSAYATNYNARGNKDGDSWTMVQPEVGARL